MTEAWRRVRYSVCVVVVSEGGLEGSRIHCRGYWHSHSLLMALLPLPLLLLAVCKETECWMCVVGLVWQVVVSSDGGCISRWRHGMSAALIIPRVQTFHGLELYSHPTRSAAAAIARPSTSPLAHHLPHQRISRFQCAHGHLQNLRRTRGMEEIKNTVSLKALQYFLAIVEYVHMTTEDIFSHHDIHTSFMK